jgi:hypothetical protein
MNVGVFPTNKFAVMPDFSGFLKSHEQSPLQAAEQRGL